ncbi:MAG: low molecular weight protein-tyrosine-phosphatase [Bacilli bacterium]
MISVLFVCLGNICRSPMAEAVFRNLVQKQGLVDKIHVDSAGTGDWHLGHQPHEGTRKLLDEKKIGYDGMYARQISNEDLDSFHYVIAMDASNVGNIRKMAGYQKNISVARLLDFVPEQSQDDVPDPYYTGNFEEVYDLITSGCVALLAHICEEQQLR